MPEGTTLNVATAKQLGEGGFVATGNIAGESVMIAAGTNEVHGDKVFIVVNGKELAAERAAALLNGIGVLDSSNVKGNNIAAEQAFIRAKVAVNGK